MERGREARLYMQREKGIWRKESERETRLYMQRREKGMRRKERRENIHGRYIRRKTGNIGRTDTRQKIHKTTS